MPMMTQRDRELELEAMKIASESGMSYHADSCPHLISGGRNYCRCNSFSSALDKLRKAEALRMSTECVTVYQLVTIHRVGTKEERVYSPALNEKELAKRVSRIVS